MNLVCGKCGQSWILGSGMDLIRSFVILMLMGVALTGCDDLLGEKADDRRREAQEHQEAEKQEEARAEFAASLGKVAYMKRVEFEKTVKSLPRQVEVLQTDMKRYTEAVSKAMAETNSENKPEKFEIKILHAMRDPDVAALAVKYLGSDFTAKSAEFIERVRMARSEETRYRKALADVDSAYEKAVNETQSWTQSTRDQRENEIKRLKSDISRLERKRSEARREAERLSKHSLIGNRRQEGEKREKGIVIEQKLNDYEREIDKKRRQIDLLTHPDQISATESVAVRRSQNVISHAGYIRESQLRDIEKTMKPKKFPADIAAECEAETLCLLQETIQTKLLTEQRELEAKKGHIQAIRDIEPKIATATHNELLKFQDELVGMK